MDHFAKPEANLRYGGGRWLMGHFAGVPPVPGASAGTGRAWVAGKKMLLTPFLGVLAGFVFLFLFAPGSAQAATYYWVGGNGDNVGTNANDWHNADPTGCMDGTGSGAVPGASDIAVFDPDCDNNATIAANWSVAGISIVSGYTGTLTQNTTNTLTVGSSNYSQAGGTFTGGGVEPLILRSLRCRQAHLHLQPVR